MYIYQGGKLYVQEEDHLVGVEIYPDKVVKVKGTETKMGDTYEVCTPYEVRCRFHLDEVPYIFPQESKEGVTNEPVDNTKKPSRGRPRK